MRITKVREVIATLFCLFLIAALGIGAAVVMGVKIPVVSNWLGQ